MTEFGLPDPLDRVQTALLTWYDEEHRDFPWRDTTEPYPILVAEVMSQQTQLERVETAWAAFLDRWPTVDSLAAESPGEVIAFWSTHRLGYNRRAEYLHAAATHVVEEWDGTFPDSPERLTDLKGVGPYTANAVASFAFNNGDAVVDTNVKRVVSRLSDSDDPENLPFEDAAAQLMPSGESRRWNNAIMELGGTICQPRPRCDDASCPWRSWCHAYATGDFTAPDVPEQPSFEGSRRQFRGRVVRAVSNRGELTIAELGPRIRVDFDPEDADHHEWLRDLVAGLAEDGLVATSQRADGSLSVGPRQG